VTALADVDLVLASTSRYRAELLRRLTPSFRQIAPDVDESRHAGESPAELAGRLAFAKATAIARRCTGAVVIGSDQVASCDDTVLGKPGTVDAAIAQLERSAGRAVDFHTAVCVVDNRDGDLRAEATIDLTRVTFRNLSARTIADYVARERPLDCAGSFKCEGLGIALMHRIDASDPTALVGLPLIGLVELLRRFGIDAV
jgi:septum formation protein